MRFYARFSCGNSHFQTSWYKISYDTRAKKRFLDKCDDITRLRLVLQTHTRQQTFHRTRIVMYYYLYAQFLRKIFSTVDTAKNICNFNVHVLEVFIHKLGILHLIYMYIVK